MIIIDEELLIDDNRRFLIDKEDNVIKFNQDNTGFFMDSLDHEESFSWKINKKGVLIIKTTTDTLFYMLKSKDNNAVSISIYKKKSNKDDMINIGCKKYYIDTYADVEKKYNDDFLGSIKDKIKSFSILEYSMLIFFFALTITVATIMMNQVIFIKSLSLSFKVIINITIIFFSKETILILTMYLADIIKKHMLKKS